MIDSMQQQTPLKTYMIILLGGGLNTPQLITMKGDRDDIANRCTELLNRGMEIYMFSMAVEPRGSFTWTPVGATHLKQEFHLYNAQGDTHEKLEEINNFLAEHSQKAGVTYLEILLEGLNKELTNLREDIHHAARVGQSPLVTEGEKPNPTGT